MSDTTMVLYHADCPDGFGAAWAASKALGRCSGVIYVPVQYGQPYPPEIDGGISRLYILDFSYPRATMGRLANAAKEIVCLDHHKTAEAELAGLPYAKFDMDKSGAVLAWEYFHPGDDLPLLLSFVEDRDLWRWGLPESREFSAALSVYPRDFNAWDDLDRSLDKLDGMEKFLAVGRAILSHQDHLVERLASKAHMADVGGYRVPTVNSSLFQSELGDRMCRDHPDAPFAAVFFSTGPDEEVWSLRSRNGFDVSAVAKSLGGGGHAAAAGFKVAKRS
jgi:oligoribonuclease NrnB/cAMP/cGMP phosphodiesterase (DHH superfamily)